MMKFDSAVNELKSFPEGACNSFVEILATIKKEKKQGSKTDTQLALLTSDMLDDVFTRLNHSIVDFNKKYTEFDRELKIQVYKERSQLPIKESLQLHQECSNLWKIHKPDEIAGGAPGMGAQDRKIDGLIKIYQDGVEMRNHTLVFFFERYVLESLVPRGSNLIDAINKNMNSRITPGTKALMEQRDYFSKVKDLFDHFETNFASVKSLFELCNRASEADELGILWEIQHYRESNPLMRLAI
jgi:hypothetical protein